MAMTDPTVYPQGGQEGGEGATGSPPPGPDEALKKENAELRATNRMLQAKALGAEHGLSPTQVELLGGIDLDKQADVAKRLHDEAKPPTPPEPTSQPPAAEQQAQQPPEQQPPTPQATPEQQAQQQAQDAMAGGGESPYPVTPKGSDPLTERVMAAVKDRPPHEAFEEIKRIQLEEQQKAREG